MRTNESTLAGARGVTLHTVAWEPESEPVADVVLIHGLGEHCGRYAEVAEHLTSHGFQVAALDLRGHGRSTGLDKGTVDDFDLMVDDVAAYIESVRTTRPLFIYGHSMGGLTAVRLGQRSEAGIAGYVLTSPALVAAESLPNFLVKIVNVLGKLLPRLPTVALEGDAISRVQQVRDDYDSDPLNYRGKLRAGTARQVNLAMAKGLADAGRITKPVLIVHGEADRLTSVRGSRQLATTVTSSDCTLRTWPGAYHELHHEPERVEVLDTIVSWLQHHLNE